MGNTSCYCVRRQSPIIKDKNSDSEPKLELKQLTEPRTPYDNEPDSSSKMEDSFLLEPSDISIDIITETPIVAHKSGNNNLYQNRQSFPTSSFQSNCPPNIKRATSIFSEEEPNEEAKLSLGINAEIYDIILRELLTNYYPINDAIVNEMIARNLLLPEDGEIILSDSSKTEQCMKFLNNFVFSEVNICKLATFLNVLLTDKSQILVDLKRSDSFYQSIVDHIYYVINILSLFKESFKDEDRLSGKIFFSNMISVICSKIILSKTSIIPFYAKVDMSNITIPENFSKSFACINEHFHCCRELILSSCDLRPIDIFYLSKGMKVSGTLTDLDISSNPITDEGLGYLGELFLSRNKLRSLNIACCSLTMTGLERFLETLMTNLSKCTLTHLYISHNKLRDTSKKHVLYLTKLPITCLEIKSINLRHQSVLFESLKLNYSLQEVDFSGNKLVSNDITYLAAGLAYNSSIERVSLVKMGLLKMDCLTINNTLLMNKSIVSVDLSDNLIGDEGAEIIKDILTMKTTLRELYLKRCGISLHGTLLLLRKASEMECNLKLLDLCYNHSPRMSIVVDIKDNIRKIQDLMRHVTLVKDMRILLWGTLDEPLQVLSDFKDF